MKHFLFYAAILASTSARAEADSEFNSVLDKFRYYNKCEGYFHGYCTENRTSDYSRKERGKAAILSTCNVGHAELRIAIRRKMIRNWETVQEYWVQPNTCRAIKAEIDNTIRRQFEIKIDNPHGSKHHVMRAFVRTEGALDLSHYPHNNGY